MLNILSHNRMLLKSFTGYAKWLTHDIRQRAAADAEALGEPAEYLNSSQINKEQQAWEIAERDQIDNCESAGGSLTLGDRRVRLLLGYQLIHKILNTHRYQFTELGRTSIPAILHVQQATTSRLLTLAA